MLEISVPTYRLKRVFRIGTVVSNIEIACRGITAGSGFATTEIKLAMLRLVLKIGLAHPTVTHTLFVDHMSPEMIGPADHIVDQLGRSVNEIVVVIGLNQLELSDTKCVCVHDVCG